jgi:hypothetical protein
MTAARRLATSRGRDLQPAGDSDRLGAIFLHSGFRTSSTWLWKHFRANDAFRAYYEFFHENLAWLKLESAIGIRSDQWRSRHPVAAPYFLEFIPLIRPEGGVKGFVKERALGSNFFAGGNGAGGLVAGEDSYVGGLIDDAQRAGRIPVLACTRTLGRSAALRQAFGGLHILVRRNLFHQWNSFSGQHRVGNPYFIDYLFNIVDHAEHEPFMELLRSYFALHPDIELIRLVESRYDDAFALFVAWHVYMTLFAGRSSDLVINVTQLAADPTYRGEIEEQLRLSTRHSFDLSDVAGQIDAPWRPVSDIETVKLVVRTLIDRAYALLAATPDEQMMGEMMLEEAWIEHRRFTAYTKVYTAEIDTSLKQAAADAASARSAIEEDAARLKVENEALRQNALATEAALVAAGEREAAVTAAADEAGREIGKLTDEFRLERERTHAARANETRTAAEREMAVVAALNAAHAEIARLTSEHEHVRTTREVEAAAAMERETAHAAALDAAHAEIARLTSEHEHVRTTREVEAAAAMERETAHAAALDAAHAAAVAATEREAALAVTLDATQTELTRVTGEYADERQRDQADREAEARAAAEREATLMATVETQSQMIHSAQEAHRAAQEAADELRSAALLNETALEAIRDEAADLRRTLDYAETARRVAADEAAEAQRLLAYQQAASTTAAGEMQLQYDELQTQLTGTASALLAEQTSHAEIRATSQELANDLAAAMAAQSAAEARVLALEEALAEARATTSQAITSAAVSRSAEIAASSEREAALIREHAQHSAVNQEALEACRRELRDAQAGLSGQVARALRRLGVQ